MLAVAPKGTQTKRMAIITYHSRSLYMIVKKTCRNRFTAFINTANRYSHASPDIVTVGRWVGGKKELLLRTKVAPVIGARRLTRRRHGMRKQSMLGRYVRRWKQAKKTSTAPRRREEVCGRRKSRGWRLARPQSGGLAQSKNVEHKRGLFVLILWP